MLISNNLKYYFGNETVKGIYLGNNNIYTPPYNNFTQNLLAYWSFDEFGNVQPDFGNYTTVIENTMSHEDGVYKGGVGFAPLGGGLTERLRVSQNLWNVTTSPLNYSMAFWVRKNFPIQTGLDAIFLGSHFGDMGFVFKNVAADGQNLGLVFSFTLSHGNQFGQFVEFRGAEVTRSMDVDTWYHLVGTYNLQQQTAKLYINGQLVATNPAILNNACPNPNWTGFTINGSAVGTDSSQGGRNYSFDMLGFWSRTLTDSEVQLLYTDYAQINDFIV